MSLQRGASVVELLVAFAVLLVISGAVVALLHDGLAGAPALEETTDLHQRARVAAEAIAADVRKAAAGTPSGPLTRLFAAVDPRTMTAPPGSAVDVALTLRYVPEGGAHARLAQPLPAVATVAAIAQGGSCPAGTTACGFTAGTRAVVFDSGGNASMLAVGAIGPGALSISDAWGARTVAYAAGDEIADVADVTFVFDPAARVLRREEAGVSFVLADNVADLRFEYLDDALQAMPLAIFQDGPFGGADAMRFDVDLLRVRAVRISVRLESGVDALRGLDPRRFMRPGTATGVRVVPDVSWRVDVALRNGGS